MKSPSSSLLHRALADAHIAGAASLLLIASLGSVVAKGKPGGGNPPPPPPPPVRVEYKLTWLASPAAGFRIHDVNSTGIAVGSTYPANSLSADGSFWTTANGDINPLTHRWNLPSGWRMGWGEKQINESNQVCGVIVNEQTSEHQLFIANLNDSTSLETLGAVPTNAQWFHMNESGDIAFVAVGGPYLYVRSSNQIFKLAETLEEPELINYYPTGLNHSLQLSMVSFNRDFATNGNGYDGSARLTFHPAGPTGVLEILNDVAVIASEAIALPWDINNSGFVLGAYEDRAPKGRSRTTTAKAGFVAEGSLDWSALSPLLPVGSTNRGGTGTVQYAASALNGNNAGQVLGGYEVWNGVSRDLWLLHPDDGLLNLDNLVVGTVAADVTAFRAAENLRGVELSEVEPVTGYGIISGYAFGTPHRAFILSPRFVQQ